MAILYYIFKDVLLLDDYGASSTKYKHKEEEKYKYWASRTKYKYKDKYKKMGK